MVVMSLGDIGVGDEAADEKHELVVLYWLWPAAPKLIPSQDDRGETGDLAMSSDAAEAEARLVKLVAFKLLAWL